VATSFDSKREVQEKYPTALGNMEALAKLGASVYHSVDATRLAGCLASKKEVRCGGSESFQYCDSSNHGMGSRVGGGSRGARDGGSGIVGDDLCDPSHSDTRPCCWPASTDGSLSG
jgi:hypothetical protein